MDFALTSEVKYVLLLLGLFLLPRALQRFNIPTAITSFALGALAAIQFGLFTQDVTISFLSAIGIISLFLFAGLEVDLAELREGASILAQHLAIHLVSLAGVAWAVYALVDIDPRAAMLVALALLTPSTGFILDSIASLKLSEGEEFWVRSKAISSELVALAILFFTLQSDTIEGLAISTTVVVVMIILLPWLFRVFFRAVLPYAPKSEFPFLIILAVVCGILTKKLGVYYLVGAFVVGMTAHRFLLYIGEEQSVKLLGSVEALAALFVPFYFFHAGSGLGKDDFSLAAAGAGLLFLATMLPLRIWSVTLHRRLALKESFGDAMRVAVPLVPTLVFTLVIAGILRTKFEIPGWLFGGLIVYTVGNTILPSLLHRMPPPEFEDFSYTLHQHYRKMPVPPAPQTTPADADE